MWLGCWCWLCKESQVLYHLDIFIGLTIWRLASLVARDPRVGTIGQFLGLASDNICNYFHNILVMTQVRPTRHEERLHNDTNTNKTRITGALVNSCQPQIYLFFLLMFLFPHCLLWFVPQSSLPLKPRTMGRYPPWVLVLTPKLLLITELINGSQSSGLSISASKPLLLHVFIKRTMLFGSCHQLTGHQPTCQSLPIFHKFSVICNAIFHSISSSIIICLWRWQTKSPGFSVLEPSCCQTN